MNKYEAIFNDELRKHNITVRQYRTRCNGRAYYKKREISCPHPKSVVSLYICLHEVGHIVEGKRPTVMESEVVAEQYAVRRLRALGMRVPLKVIKRTKRYVAMKVYRARKRGLQSVPASVRAFLRGWSYAEVCDCEVSDCFHIVWG